MARRRKAETKGSIKQIEAARESWKHGEALFMCAVERAQAEHSYVTAIELNQCRRRAAP